MINLTDLQEVKTFVSSLLVYLSDRFYLKNVLEYHVRINHNDTSPSAGQCIIDSVNKLAEIEINVYQNDTIDELINTVIHEFCHCLIHEFAIYGWHTAGFLGDSNTEDDLFRSLNEPIAKRLSRVILEHTNTVKDFKKIWKNA